MNGHTMMVFTGLRLMRPRAVDWLHKCRSLLEAMFWFTRGTSGGPWNASAGTGHPKGIGRCSCVKLVAGETRKGLIDRGAPEVCGGGRAQAIGMVAACEGAW
jgi:hypothetical protein